MPVIHTRLSHLFSRGLMVVHTLTLELSAVALYDKCVTFDSYITRFKR